MMEEVTTMQEELSQRRFKNVQSHSGEAVAEMIEKLRAMQDRLSQG